MLVNFHDYQIGKTQKGSLLVTFYWSMLVVAVFLVFGYQLARYKGIIYSDTYKIKYLERKGLIPVLDRTDSLTGIDANNNGIRDDIEIYIEKKFTDPKQKAAVQQFARAMQAEVTADYKNEIAVRNILLQANKSSKCMFDTFDQANIDTRVYYPIMDEIEAMTANTKKDI